MCLLLYSSFPEWFRGRVAAHVVLLEGFGVEAFATGDHGTGHAGFAHFVHSCLAFHRHPHGTRYAAGRWTCVLGVGAAAVEVALVLRCRTGVLSHWVLCRVGARVARAGSRLVLLHHLGVWRRRSQPALVDHHVLGLLTLLLLGRRVRPFAWKARIVVEEAAFLWRFRAAWSLGHFAWAFTWDLSLRRVRLESFAWNW